MILARYYEDHPDLAAANGMLKGADFASTTYAVQFEMDRVTQPVIAVAAVLIALLTAYRLSRFSVAE